MSPAPSVVPVNKSRDENQELDNAVPTVDGGLCPCGGLCGMLIELTINDAFQPSVLILHQSFVPSAACTEKPLLERLEHVSVPSTNEGMSLCKSPETLAPSVASVNRSLEENQEPNYVVPTVDGFVAIKATKRGFRNQKLRWTYSRRKAKGKTTIQFLKTKMMS
ncbi:hypothetical protein Pcinc_005690 [Petrolisthes cinctipes]|uniref:Uncharacterized protein n=1 Tax=Petrolisthes cinctipes TaxID=88211 RepID=A0AAE1GC16_PETCI|nr:hypothetical protein Pcinc_005690 [Petrolisthes cinctipes]